MGRLKEFGYKNVWFPWIHHNLSPNDDRKRLQIVKLLLGSRHRLFIYRLNLNWQIDMDLMQQLREKRA